MRFAILALLLCVFCHDAGFSLNCTAAGHRDRVRRSCGSCSASDELDVIVNACQPAGAPLCTLNRCTGGHDHCALGHGIGGGTFYTCIVNNESCSVSWTCSNSSPAWGPCTCEGGVDGKWRTQRMAVCGAWSNACSLGPVQNIAGSFTANAACSVCSVSETGVIKLRYDGAVHTIAGTPLSGAAVSGDIIAAKGGANYKLSVLPTSSTDTKKSKARVKTSSGTWALKCLNANCLN